MPTTLFIFNVYKKHVSDISCNAYNECKFKTVHNFWTACEHGLQAIECILFAGVFLTCLKMLDTIKVCQFCHGFWQSYAPKRSFPIDAHVKVPKIASPVSIAEFC